MIPRRFLGSYGRSVTAASGPCSAPGTCAPRSWWPSRRCPTVAEPPARSGRTS